MKKEKNVFDWKGEPSIWTKDKELRQFAAGQAFGRNARERIALTEKRDFFIYSKAKLGK
jgi:hypothetical protein